MPKKIASIIILIMVLFAGCSPKPLQTSTPSSATTITSSALIQNTTPNSKASITSTTSTSSKPVQTTNNTSKSTSSTLSSSTTSSITTTTETTVPPTPANPPAQGDWVIDSNQIAENQNIILNGNLIVKNGSTLTLNNVNLTMNVSNDGEYGISVEPGSSMIIDHSIIASATQYRFSFVVQGNSFKMEDSSLHGCGWGIPYTANDITKTGLYLRDVKDMVIEGSTFSDGYYGLILQSLSSGSIKDNIFSAMDDSGIYLSGTSSNIIDGNSFSCNLFGVYSLGSHDNIISNNTFSGSFGEAPIWLMSGCEDNTVSKNIISTPTSWAGIAIGANGFNISNNNLIIDNTITGGGNGIAIYCSQNNRVENNSITGAHIGIVLGCANGNDILNNTIIRINPSSGTLDEVEQNAIELYNSSNNTIANNSLSSALEHGILLLNLSSDNVLEGNSITSCQRGIGLYNQSDNNHIVNNSIDKTLGNSITLHNTNSNVIYSNNFIDDTDLPFDDGVNQWESKGKGNYWSEYNGIDTNSDGTGDSPQTIAPNGIDNSPLMNPASITFFTVPRKKNVPITSLPPQTFDSNVISTDVVWQAATIIYDGGSQIVVANGGTLTIEGITLSLPWYFSGIIVQAGGKLNIIDSTIKPAQLNGEFLFTVQKDGILIMKNSELDGCGFAPLSGDWGGLHIQSTNIDIENTSINNSVRGMIIDLSLQDIQNSTLTIINNIFSNCWVPFWASPPEVQGHIENNAFINCVKIGQNGINWAFP